MRILLSTTAALVIGCLSATAAQAACTGTNGRGWGSGNGAGAFQMTTADRNCRIGFPNFINDRARTSIPATRVSVTRPPRSGKVAVTGRGIVYTPAKGFTGSDTFCTRNTSPKVPGQALSGCITVTVR